MSFFGAVLVVTVFAVAVCTGIAIKELVYAGSINSDMSQASAAVSLETQQALVASMPGQMQNYTAAVSGIEVVDLNGTYLIEGGNGYIYSFGG